MTVTIAVAMLPLPPSLEVTAPVTLVFIPGDVAAMSMLNSHSPPPGMVRLGALIIVVPGVATYGSTTVQLPKSAKLLGVAIMRPSGSVSETLTSVKVVEFGLVIVKLSLVVEFEPKEASLKTFVM
jgi:hypothetical protein